MAEEDQTEDGDGQPAKKKGGLIIMILVSLIAIGGGLMAPLVVTQLAAPSEDGPTEEQMAEPDPDEEVDFIPFDEVTVNLSEARFSRYLRINFSLQVAASQRAEIETKVKQKAVIFKNWMNLHLSERRSEDLEGTFGRNKVRREIQDLFNEVLFEDGIERIQDVLFEEFHIQ